MIVYYRLIYFLEGGYDFILKKDYLKMMREGKALSTTQLILMTVRLSIPTILAQISIIIMEYIDEAMVGSLGGNATASIGLVSSTTWLFGGICFSICIGFGVLVAQRIGAGDDAGARRMMQHGMVFSFLFSFVLSAVGIGIHSFLPVWLGGKAEVLKDASSYFLVFSIALPVRQLNSICTSFLQNSGNTKTPGILETLLCVFDVGFNYIFINVFSLGVTGAALGSAVSELVILAPMMIALLAKNEHLRIRKNEAFHYVRGEIGGALKIALPACVEQIIMSSAYITSTAIVSPLGTVSLAAHSLAITAESFCYMPGYGIAAAASTMVGQSIGAKREDLRIKLSYISTCAGMLLMGISGVVMYFLAPLVMRILTPVESIYTLGAEVLRIELFAEPLFAASIVATGVFRGAGDTLAPSAMNLISMWGVRIPLSAFLAHRMGLRGVWIAMLIELIFRGTIFLARLIYKNEKIRKNNLKTKSI